MGRSDRRPRHLALLAAALAMLASGTPGHAKSPQREPAAAADFTCRPSHDGLARQRSQVEDALGQIERVHAEALDAIDAAGGLARAEIERRVDRAVGAYRASRRRALAPLAEQGNVEAMVRLASDVRDSARPAEIARWLALTTCAASGGHPLAADELVRWYWHQRREGSIEEVQRNRATALDWTERAARSGALASIDRVAVYIAGNVHQYPADPDLARRLLELCARTDFAGCEDSLVGGPYDYGLSPRARAFWLIRLAARQPLSYQPGLDRALASLAPADREALRNEAAQWRPVAWRDLEPEWRTLRAEILAHGAASIGADTVCTTQTPWCRGALIPAARTLKP